MQTECTPALFEFEPVEGKKVGAEPGQAAPDSTKRTAARFGTTVATLMTRFSLHGTRQTINSGPNRPDATQSPP